MDQFDDLLYQDDLYKEVYLGRVEDISDPKFKFRCKVRVFGIFGFAEDLKNQISTKDLPWASPISSQFGSKSGGGNYSVPKVGTLVRVVFDGDLYHPKYLGINEVPQNLINLVKSSYENAKIISYDEEENTAIFYTKLDGLVINIKDSTFIMKPNNNIVINHKDSTSSIELNGPDIDIVTNNSTSISSVNNITLNTELAHINGGRVRLASNPIFSVAKAEGVMLLFRSLATIIDAKLPVSGGVASNLCNALEPYIVSKTVTVSP